MKYAVAIFLLLGSVAGAADPAPEIAVKPGETAVIFLAPDGKVLQLVRIGAAAVAPAPAPAPATAPAPAPVAPAPQLAPAPVAPLPTQGVPQFLNHSICPCPCCPCGPDCLCAPRPGHAPAIYHPAFWLGA